MNERPHVAVFLAVSLDGMIADAQHGLGWLMPHAGNDTAATGYDALMARTDTLLMGRRTYDVVRGFGQWPYDGKRVGVMTHRPHEVTRPAEPMAAGSLLDVLEALHRDGARHVYVDGGDVVRQALRADVVDELTLSWVPVVLGDGVPLFDRALPLSRWRTRQCRTLPSGLVQAVYEPAELAVPA